MIYKDYLESTLSHCLFYLQNFDKNNDKIFVKLLVCSSINNTSTVDTFNMKCLANRQYNKYILTMKNLLIEEEKWGNIFIYFLTFEFNELEEFKFIMDNNIFSSCTLKINKDGVFYDEKKLEIYTSDYIKLEKYSDTKIFINKNSIPVFPIILNDEWDIISNIMPLEETNHSVKEINGEYLLQWDKGTILEIEKNLFAFLTSNTGGSIILNENPDFILNNKLESDTRFFTLEN